MAILTLMAGNVFAQYGNGPRSGQRAEFKKGPANGLELTESQQREMETLRLKLQKEILPIRNSIGENRARMRTLTTADNADLKAINKLIDQNSDLQAQMAKLRAAHHQEVRKILTEEQRIKFDSRAFARGNRNGSHGEQNGRQQGPRMRGQGEK
jgi:Spy/CpxP family protein refolding chaperone